MTTAFRLHRNLALTRITVDYLVGSGELVVESASEFGDPTAESPLAITLARQSTAFSVNMDQSNATIFLVTDVTGNTLTVEVAEGTTDRDYFAGDYVICAPTAADLDDLQSALNVLEADSATTDWVVSQNYATEPWVLSQGFATTSWVIGRDYATEAYVDAQIAAIPSVDLTGYATESWVVNQGYATTTWVSSQNYATQTWVSSRGYATQSWVTGQNYVTQSWINSQGFATQSWVTGQGFAKINSPAFMGTPTAPTAAANDRSQQIATTGWVQTNVSTPGKTGWVLGAGQPVTAGADKTAWTIVDQARRATGVYLCAKTAPTGASLILDILMSTDGGNTFNSLWPTNPTNRPTLAAGSKTGSTTSFDVTALPARSLLRIDVVQVGTTTAGEEVTVQLQYV